jgi:hypothetical protein
MIIRGLQTVAQERRLIVLDLGYSRNQASCAIVATDPPTRRELTFGEAIEVTVGFLVEPVPSILILEAVLSTYHRPDGNPDIRGQFEKGRGWYYGPGATTHAAAMRFIRQLTGRVKADNDLLLAEAFLSFKKVKSRHLDDALTIHNKFWITQPVHLPDSCEPILDIVVGVPSVRVFKND